MRSFVKILLLIIVINSAAKYAAAQTGTSDSLQLLEDLYSAGKYEQVLQLSQSLHETARLSKEENLKRLKYTVAAYKDFGYRREADSTARLFFQKDPFYKVQNQDPLPFRDVLSNYYTMPKFSVWTAVAKNIAVPKLDTVYSIVDTMAKDPEYEIDGYTVQVGFEYRLWKNVSFSVAPTFSMYEMQRTMPRTTLATFRYNEKFNTLTVPLIAEVWLYMGKEMFIPSIYFGAQFKYIISSKYKAYTNAVGSYTKIPDEKNNVNLKNRHNSSLLSGARFNYNNGRITLFADLGISCDLYRFNAEGTTSVKRELIYQNLYVPDMFKLIEFSLKVGIKVNLQYKTIAKNRYGY